MKIYYHRLYCEESLAYDDPTDLPETGTTWVYFVERPNGAIKIGYSYMPWERIRALQTASEEPLRLLCCLEGDHKLETILHHQLCRYRISGEWFQAEAVRRWLKTFLGDLGHFDGSNELIS